DRDEPDILGVNVYRIVAGVGDADFELARKISLAVERLDFGPRLAVVDLFAVQPDVVIGAGARQKAPAQLFGDALDVVVVAVGGRSGAKHGIARDVSTGRKRSQERFVDRTNGRFQIALDHAVQLEIL